MTSTLQLILVHLLDMSAVLQTKWLKSHFQPTPSLEWPAIKKQSTRNRKGMCSAEIAYPKRISIILVVSIRISGNYVTPLPHIENSDLSIEDVDPLQEFSADELVWYSCQDFCFSFVFIFIRKLIFLVWVWPISVCNCKSNWARETLKSTIWSRNYLLIALKSEIWDSFWESHKNQVAGNFGFLKEQTVNFSRN